MPDFKEKDYLQRIEQKADDARIVRKVLLIVVAAMVILMAAGIGGGYYYIQSALNPVNPDSHKKIEVKIPLGSSVSEIAHRLDDKGIIKNAFVFHAYVKYKNVNGFQAGTYLLSPSMDIKHIIDQLKNGKVDQKLALKMTFPEGISISKVADIIAAHTNLKKSEIIKKMKDRSYIQKNYMKHYPFLTDKILKKGIRYPLEGYLFPATYSFTKKNPSLEAIIHDMLDKTSAVLKQFQPQISNSKMNVHQVLTLASMIQAESTNDTNRGGISSVFHNRLKKGMPLQSDPTVNYAAGKHRVQLTSNDTKLDSPYNTYKYKGLPIGPIDNPGEKSIDAALNPTSTDDLYFYARPNGKVEFAKNYQGFLQLKHKYEGKWKTYIENQKKKH